MLPETFQHTLNNALSCVMHVCQPKDTIFSTSFKYDMGRPNVNRHIWIECSAMKVARYIGNYKSLHYGYEPFLNMI